MMPGVIGNKLGSNGGIDSAIDAEERFTIAKRNSEAGPARIGQAHAVGPDSFATRNIGGAKPELNREISRNGAWGRAIFCAREVEPSEENRRVRWELLGSQKQKSVAPSAFFVLDADLIKARWNGLGK